MKLAGAISHDREQARVAKALAAGIAFTKVASAGGFLHQNGRIAFMVNVEHAERF